MAKRKRITPSTSSVSETEATAPSGVSMKSDASMGHPVSFNINKTRSETEATAPSGVSMKSDASMGHPVSFNINKTRSETEATAPSGVSMKSDASMGHPVSFNINKTRSKRKATAPSGVSMMSDASMGHPVSFNFDKTRSQLTGEPSSCSVCGEALRDLVLFGCGHWTCKPCGSSDWDQYDSPADYPCVQCGKKVRLDSEECTGSSHLEVKKNYKDEMQKKYAWTSEGIGDQKTSLKKIYSEVIITTGESEGPHEEHTFRHIKYKLQQQTNKQSINLSDLFRSDKSEEKPLRTVLTKGVAGIGKSFTVQKFILDWAEEKENHDIDFVFCLAFREMNLIKGDRSLHELLTEFHPALPKDSEVYIKSKVIVILDGLDESRLQLDFDDQKIIFVSEVTSVSNLLANLIQGKLLPQAKLWITSRPAAASQIPATFVDIVTEITGFSDSQKEEYFRRRFIHDLSLAERIISHIHQSQSLDIMCQIPIFCWISALLFEEIFGGDKTAEIPQTLTEMMAHYVFAQTKHRNRKYEKTEENDQGLLMANREFLLKLGKLAFVHLQNNNLIFYNDDLEECGIDMKEATIYSGFCSAVLREEEFFSQKKTFFFVHLTIQEFFAALFVYDCFSNRNTNELRKFLGLKYESEYEVVKYAVLDLLKMTIDKVLNKNGHLDFFLRFLVGLMVEPNWRVLQGLLTPLDPGQDLAKKILTYLKAIRRKAISPDECINLFQAMVEMRDHKVKDEIQEYLKLPERQKTELTPLRCSALAYMLQVSKNNLDVLDLKSYNTSDEGRRRLIPAVRTSRKAILVDCRVTEEWIEHLAFGLRFPYMPLENLDLSNNDLKDSGVQLLCDGLSNQHCRLKILRLSGCQVTQKGCDHLADALKLNPSHLMELDLSYNNLGDSGVKSLTNLRDNPQFKLQTLKW